MTTTAINALMRRRLFEQIYNRMTDEEKHLFAQLTMQDKSHAEIMQALQQQQSQLEDLRRRQQTFGEDFLSNIAGNAAFDGLMWLTRRLARMLR